MLVRCSNEGEDVRWNMETVVRALFRKHERKEQVGGLAHRWNVNITLNLKVLICEVVG